MVVFHCYRYHRNLVLSSFFVLKNFIAGVMVREQPAKLLFDGSAMIKGADHCFTVGYLAFPLEKETPLGYIDRKWAVNSVGECYLHTVEVTGSNPVPPTNETKGAGHGRSTPFIFPA